MQAPVLGCELLSNLYLRHIENNDFEVMQKRIAL